MEDTPKVPNTGPQNEPDKDLKTSNEGSSNNKSAEMKSANSEMDQKDIASEKKIEAKSVENSSQTNESPKPVSKTETSKDTSNQESESKEGSSKMKWGIVAAAVVLVGGLSAYFLSSSNLFQGNIGIDTNISTEEMKVLESKGVKIFNNDTGEQVSEVPLEVGTAYRVDTSGMAEGDSLDFFAASGDRVNVESINICQPEQVDPVPNVSLTDDGNPDTDQAIDVGDFGTLIPPSIKDTCYEDETSAGSGQDEAALACISCDEPAAVEAYVACYERSTDVSTSVQNSDFTPEEESACQKEAALICPRLAEGVIELDPVRDADDIGIITQPLPEVEEGGTIGDPVRLVDVETGTVVTPGEEDDGGNVTGTSSEDTIDNSLTCFQSEFDAALAADQSEVEAERSAFEACSENTCDDTDLAFKEFISCKNEAERDGDFSEADQQACYEQANYCGDTSGVVGQVDQENIDITSNTICNEYLAENPITVTSTIGGNLTNAGTEVTRTIDNCTINQVCNEDEFPGAQEQIQEMYSTCLVGKINELAEGQSLTSADLQECGELAVTDNPDSQCKLYTSSLPKTLLPYASILTSTQDAAQAGEYEQLIVLNSCTEVTFTILEEGEDMVLIGTGEEYVGIPVGTPTETVTVPDDSEAPEFCTEGQREYNVCIEQGNDAAVCEGRAEATCRSLGLCKEAQSQGTFFADVNQILEANGSISTAEIDRLIESAESEFCPTEEVTELCPEYETAYDNCIGEFRTRAPDIDEIAACEDLAAQACDTPDEVDQCTEIKNQAVQTLVKLRDAETFADKVRLLNGLIGLRDVYLEAGCMEAPQFCEAQETAYDTCISKQQRLVQNGEIEEVNLYACEMQKALTECPEPTEAPTCKDLSASLEATEDTEERRMIFAQLYSQGCINLPDISEGTEETTVCREFAKPYEQCLNDANGDQTQIKMCYQVAQEACSNSSLICSQDAAPEASEKYARCLISAVVEGSLEQLSQCRNFEINICNFKEPEPGEPEESEPEPIPEEEVPDELATCEGGDAIVEMCASTTNTEACISAAAGACGIINIAQENNEINNYYYDYSTTNIDNSTTNIDNSVINNYENNYVEYAQSLPTTQCNDGIDNDGDGFIDAAQDPGCEFNPLRDSEEDTVPVNTQCTDGLDNDGDGVIDEDDPACINPLVDTEIDPQEPVVDPPAEETTEEIAAQNFQCLEVISGVNFQDVAGDFAVAANALANLMEEVSGQPITIGYTLDPSLRPTSGNDFTLQEALGQDRVFGVERPLNRAEAIKLIGISLCHFIDNNINVSETQPSAGFPDVSEEAWYWNFVNAGFYSDMIRGYADGTAQPENVITKAEFGQILLNIGSNRLEQCIAEGYEEIDSLIESGEVQPEDVYEFIDVKPTDWYFPTAKKLKACGIVEGQDLITNVSLSTNTTYSAFRGMEPVNRRTAATMLNNFFLAIQDPDNSGVTR